MLGSLMDKDIKKEGLGEYSLQMSFGISATHGQKNEACPLKKPSLPCFRL